MKSNIATMEPVNLLKDYGRFEHAQGLGKVLDYEPEIKTGRLSLKLNEWNYEEAHEAEREDLERWTKQKPGFEAILEKFIDAATPIWNSEYDYRKVLLDIREHLDLPGYPTESYAVIESQILEQLLRRVLERLPQMSQKEKEAFENSVEEKLEKEGKGLGGLSVEQALLASGGASFVSFLGAEVATGIVLSHLGVGNSILLALGLYSVPTILIGGAIFAPIAASLGIYYAGGHNYAKTIPFVAMLATLRQQELVKAGLERNR
ncbi:MAG TPA: hypothetical protein VHB20_03365 [Verrucomicrobiae bacterium]|jgi:uncharacterized protein YaaW (UPF0174 family)|nr:hypothetical protein [Verrucomicrobiae bacterium]